MDRGVRLAVALGVAALFPALTAHAEGLSEGGRALSTSPRIPLFNSGMGASGSRAPASRSYEEAKTQVQRVLQYFTPAWIESRKEVKPLEEVSPSVRDLNSIIRDLNTDDGGAARGASAQRVNQPKVKVKNDVEPLRGNPGKRQTGGGGVRGRDAAGIGENAPGDNLPQALPYWLPMCFLADPNAKVQTVNEKIKYIVDNYAKCGIVVEPYAYTVKGNYPTNVPTLQNMAKAACNFDQRFGVRGAIQMSVRSNQIPSQMCEEQGATGCSTLCEAISFSVVGPQETPVLGLHESMHSNCCGRLCVNKGQGVEPAGPGIDLVAQVDTLQLGTLEIYHAEEGTNLQAQEISQGGCQSLQQGAAPNDGSHVWMPDKQRYYAKAEDDKQVDITQYKSLFPPNRPPQMAGGSDGQGSRGGGGGGGGGGSRITFIDAPKNTTSASSYQVASGDDGRHRKARGGGIAGQLLTAVKVRLNPELTNEVVAQGPPAPGANLGGPRTSIGYDDSAPKGQAGSGTKSLAEGKGSTPVVSGPSLGEEEGVGEAGPRIGYDDDAPKGDRSLASSASPQPSGEPGLGGGRVGYDDSAPKGALATSPGATGGGQVPFELPPPSAEVYKRSEKAARIAKMKRKPGAALTKARNRREKRGDGLVARSDTLISTRPAPDFLVNSGSAGAELE